MAATMLTGSVLATAPARVHFGLHNLSGLHGRVDGGAGLALAQPRWSGTVAEGVDTSQVVAVGAVPVLSNDLRESALRALEAARARWDLPPLVVRLTEAVPSHVGLGAKTSLLMLVGAAAAAFAGTSVTARELGALVDRGGTSGVGVHLSSVGGAVVDRGHVYPHEKSRFGPSRARLAAAPPELALHAAAPPGWRVVHLRFAGAGLSGRDEQHFFDQNCPVPEDETDQLLRAVAGLLLPALRDGDLTSLHRFLDIQQRLSLKRREWEVQGARTKRFAAAWRSARSADPALPPLCLSSLGPTMFCVTDAAKATAAAVRCLAGPGVNIAVSAVDPEGVCVREENRA